MNKYRFDDAFDLLIIKLRSKSMKKRYFYTFHYESPQKVKYAGIPNKRTGAYSVKGTTRAFRTKKEQVSDTGKPVTAKELRVLHAGMTNTEFEGMIDDLKNDADRKYHNGG